MASAQVLGKVVACIPDEHLPLNQEELLFI